jgi:predicted DNA-binding protein YlxM (UPF0122 family)
MTDSIPKKVNRFFDRAVKRDIEGLEDQLLLTDRQYKIFTLFYLERKDINYISDQVFLSPSSVEKDLRKIRKKIVNHLPLE